MLFNWGIGVGLIHAVKRTLSTAIGALFTYNMADGVLESGQTFSRASTAYHKQPDGTWVAVASGEARFSGMRRVSQGVYSALDSGGAALPGPFGLLLEPALTNSATKSFPAGWTATPIGGTGTLTAVAGIDGALSAGLFEDTSNTTVTKWRQAAVGHSDSATAVFWIKQDTDTARFPSVAMPSLFGINYTDNNVQVNTVTGATIVTSQTRCTITASSVVEDGIIKVALVRRISPTQNNTSTLLDFSPANGTSWGAVNAGAMGSATLLYAAVFYGEVAPEVALAHTPIATTTGAVARAVDTIAISGVPADNETRITYSDGSTADLDDWDGTAPTPTAPVVIRKIEVYAPGGRPA